MGAMRPPRKLPPVRPLSSEWFLLKFLAKWRPEHIRLAAKRKVDLVKLYSEEGHKNPLARLLYELAKKNGGIAEHFTPENTLYWLAVRRPDLYRAVVTDEETLKWRTEQMERLRAWLWGR